MPAVGAIRVRDLDKLQRAFAAADKALKQDLRDALEEAASPVRRDAKQNVLREITNVGETRQGRSAWSDMRVGVAAGTIVYVAPVERGVKTKGRMRLARPNLADLMMPEMQNALESNREQIAHRLEVLLDEVADVWERA